MKKHWTQTAKGRRRQSNIAAAMEEKILNLQHAITAIREIK
jgi:hypothetical protein